MQERSWNGWGSDFCKSKLQKRDAEYLWMDGKFRIHGSGKHDENTLVPDIYDKWRTIKRL